MTGFDLLRKIYKETPIICSTGVFSVIKMAFKEINNQKGNYKILAEGINVLKIKYNDLPYSGYSQESLEKARELKAVGKVQFDGPGVRLSKHSFDEKGVLSLDLDYTTYAMFMATRKNTKTKTTRFLYLEPKMAPSPRTA